MSAVSDARLAANRANAQLSTGPKTPEGKARSALNALKHGLAGARLIVLPDEQEHFEALKAALEADIQPATALELLLFDQLLHAAWNLRRIRRLEAELFDGRRDPLSDPALEARLATLARYQARAERSFHRALKELRALQAHRCVTTLFDQTVGGKLPGIMDLDKVIKQTQALGLDRIQAERSRLRPQPRKVSLAPRTAEFHPHGAPSPMPPL